MIYYLDSHDKINYTITPLTDNSIFLFESTYRYVVPDNSLVIFNSTPSGDFHAWWNNTVIPLLNNSNISCIVWDLATNPMPIDHCQTITKLHNPLPYYCYIGNFDIHKTQLSNDMIFFPFWAYWSSLCPLDTFKLNRIYKLSSLNGNDWNHRKYTYIQLAKRPYFNQMIFTFGKREHQFDNYFILSESDLDEFSKLPNIVKDTYTTKYHNINFLDLHIEHPAYRDTYINLINETTISISYAIVSEKTFKAIRAHQLFVIVATVGAVRFLRDIGIDVFDDIIDHTYDLIIDDKLQIEAVIQQLDRLMELDLPTLFAQIQPRLEKNARWLSSNEFRQQFFLSTNRN